MTYKVDPCAVRVYFNLIVSPLVCVIRVVNKNHLFAYLNCYPKFIFLTIYAYN